MSPIMPGIVASGFRRADGGNGSAGEHRYWSLLVTSKVTPAASPLTISELEFWGSPWCERLRGTVTATSTTTSYGIETTQDEGSNNTSNQSLTWGTSAALPQRITIDLGAGNEREVGGVAIWSSAYTDGAPADFSVEYSDDGSNWTLAWSDTASYPDAYRVPHVSLNPNYGGSTEPVLDVGITPTWWLDAAMSFSDAGATPAGDADPVQQITNRGSDSSPFTQATLARRPIFGASGANGRTFLSCDRAEQQYLDDIAWGNVSGLAAVTPYLIAAIVDTNPPETNQWFALTGHATVGNGSKNALFFREPADAQIHLGKSSWRTGNVANGVQLLAAAVCTSSLLILHHTPLAGPTEVARVSNASNFVSTASSSTQLLRSTVLADGGYFHGRVYEMFIVPSWTPPSGGAAPEPHPILHRIARYAQAKYGIG